MPSASSFFLLSFCFRKSCSGKFLGMRWKFAGFISKLKRRWSQKDARRGRPEPPDALQARSHPRPRLGTTWATPSPPRVAPSPINHTWRKNPRYPIIFSRRRPRPLPSPTLVREGSAALPSTLPERGIDTGGIYTTMPASGVMRE